MIRISHLSKTFRVREPGEGLGGKLRSLVAPRTKLIRAVDDLSFEIARGEIVGYLGPNGAGKSTTIKLLTGVLHPTAGSVEVNGLIPQRRRTANAFSIGVVYGQRSQLWWDLPLRDSFEILAAMYRLPAARWKASVAFFAELLEMRDFLDQPVRQLSLGQRMKGDIVAALLHEPPILYLDEPTIGLDVISRRAVLGFLQALNAERQTTILLTTHALADVAQLCPRIMIIDHGKLLLDAQQSAILERFGQERRLVIEFAEGLREVTPPEGRVVGAEGNRLTIAFDRRRISALELIHRLGLESGVKDIAIEEPDIESIVAQIYEHGPAAGDDGAAER